MQLSAALITLAISVMAVEANPVSIKKSVGSLKDYSIVPLTFVGPIKSGGPNVTIVGNTAEDVYNQIMGMNPAFKASDFESAQSESGLQARSKTSHNCNPSGGTVASESDIKAGINYLNKLGPNAMCGVGGGPSRCARISCSEHSGIFFCNDNTYPITASCTGLATYAQDIINDCAYFFFGGQVMGQEFDSQNFNVIVSGSDC